MSLIINKLIMECINFYDSCPKSNRVFYTKNKFETHDYKKKTYSKLTTI